MSELYEFRVDDADGNWGDMRCWANSEAEARVKVTEVLKDEAVPEGSLLYDSLVLTFIKAERFG